MDKFTPVKFSVNYKENKMSEMSNEIFEDYIFSVQKYSYVDNDVIKEDYFSMLLFKDKLITFSEKNNLFIKTISKMLESPSSKIRENDHNYLFYQLLDIIVDEQLVVFSFIKEQVEEIEKSSKYKSVNDLFTSGETWEIK